MLRKIEDFQKDWAYEVESTLKIFRALTDESLSQKVTPDGRSLGFLAWHLTQTLSEMLGNTGLKIDGPGHDRECPTSAAEIADAYQRSARSVTAGLSVPGVYGPAKEEWAAMGIPAMP